MINMCINPITQHYIDKDLSLDDDESLKKDD